MGRTVCAIADRGDSTRVLCGDTRACVAADVAEREVASLRDLGVEACTLPCAGGAPAADGAPCASSADCARASLCLPDGAGRGHCERCRTHADPERAACSFVPPAAAREQCVARLGLAREPDALRHFTASPMHDPRAVYSYLARERGHLEGDARAVADCMLRAEREASGCCAGGSCVARVADATTDAFVPGVCVPDRGDR